MKRQPQIISRIPLRGMSAHEWGFAIEIELHKIWRSALSTSERQSLKYTAGLLELDSVPVSASRKLDSIILSQAETLGWRITLAEMVRYRMSEWEHSAQGPDFFRKLGTAMAKAAQIMLREKLPPISDTDQWLVKNETTKELKLILGRMHGVFATRRRSPAPVEALAAFLAIVSENASSFPHLTANQDRWREFFEHNPHALGPAALGERVTPASLYDEFLAWSTGWEQEALRQTIARLKP